MSASNAPQGHILVVDDALYIRRMLVDMLTEAGYSADEAADGEGALERFRVREPDVTLLDLVLPGRSGLEILREMRAHSPNARVIVLSAAATEDKVREAVGAGAYGFLRKPVRLDDLLAAIVDAGRP